MLAEKKEKSSLMLEGYHIGRGQKWLVHFLEIKVIDRFDDKIINTNELLFIKSLIKEFTELFASCHRNYLELTSEFLLSH